MEKVKFILSVSVCKLLILIGKLMGKKGSSTPGSIALKIYPQILKKLSSQVTGGIVCVLGTNGKTTTNNMIDLIIRENGVQTVCNSVGANMLYGIVTAFADASGYFGKMKRNRAVLEIDEASAKKVFKYVSADYIVLTNLFRDQLDRYGEIESTMNEIKTAIDMAPDAVLILNADDPICMYLGKISNNKIVTYGVSEKVFSNTDDKREGRYCYNCGGELNYIYNHYNQLGNYKCLGCGFKRPEPDFSATSVSDKNKVSFVLNGEDRIKSNTYGFYNIYNILAAIAATKTMGIDACDYTRIFMLYKPQTARMEEFYFGDKTIILNLAKNPAGFNQAISTMKNDSRRKTVVFALNDDAHDGQDISWIYDVCFEDVKDECLDYGVSGTRKYDLALRLFYGDICEKPIISDDTVEIAKEFLKSDCEVIYLLVNYTVIFDAEKKLKKLSKEYKSRRLK